MKKLFIVVVLSVLVSGFISFTLVKNKPLGGGQTARTCSVTTATSTLVGDDLSQTILSAYGLRAWAVIQQPINATNTVSLSFDEGSAAVVGESYELTQSTTTALTKSQIVFGLNTDFPYTGAVTGITNLGTSTLLVTECRY